MFSFFPGSDNDDTPRVLDDAWRKRPLTYANGDEAKSGGWKDDHWQREFKVLDVDAERIFDEARARLINFDVLPIAQAQLTTLWNVETRLPQPGDVIFQRTHFVRFGGFNLVDILSATRLGEVMDAPDHFELQYISTQGHPECGTSRYRVEIDDRGRVMFRIHTISKPALWLTRLANPIITRRFQLKITHAVLDTMVQGVLMDLTE